MKHKDLIIEENFRAGLILNKFEIIKHYEIAKKCTCDECNSQGIKADLYSFHCLVSTEKREIFFNLN